MLKTIATLLLLSWFCLTVNGQVSLTGLPYFQNFDGMANTGTSNPIIDNVSPIPGWYSSRTTYRADNGSSNTGAQYAYGPTGSTDRAWGSRASGGTGTMVFGVRFVNNTGTSLQLWDVAYTGEQWRIAQKGPTDFDTLAFSYQVGTGLTDVTAGTWTRVPALDFTQIQHDPTCGSSGNSSDGELAANRAAISGSFLVNVAPGEEIMFRWVDVNNSCNDHALAVEDLTVIYSSLPVEWAGFSGKTVGNANLLEWETSAEVDNQGFSIERSLDGSTFSEIGFVESNIANAKGGSYQYTDADIREDAFYRIRQIDYDGNGRYSNIINVKWESRLTPPVIPYPNPTQLHIKLQCDLCGVFDEEEIKVKVINTQGITVMQASGSLGDVNSALEQFTGTLPGGMYWIELGMSKETQFLKFLKTK